MEHRARQPVPDHGPSELSHRLPGSASGDLPDDAPADRPRVRDQGLDTAGDAQRVASDAELAQDGQLVEVDALAGQLVAIELEDREDRQLELPARGRQAAQRALVGASHDGLDEDGIVGVVQRQELVALIREGSTGVVVVAGHLLGAVVDLPGGDQLVARVTEGVERGVELVPVLRVHVLTDDLPALLPPCGAQGHGYLPITRRTMLRLIVSGWLAAVSRRPVRLVGSRAMPSCCRTVATS